IAETVALQDFESYSHRDYDRPARDAKLGMLPPKLAQMMINLAGFTKLSDQPQSASTLYDPFCGMGTVLTEALLLKFHVVGSDINSEVLEGASQNIDWHIQEFSDINPSQLAQPLFPKDATTLESKDLPQLPDCIVTESYLGPPQKHLPDPKIMKKNFQHIQETLIRFFRNAHPLIKPHTPIIISFAAYRDKNRIHTMDQLPEQIKNLGYKIEPLISKDIAARHNLKSEQSLLYDRPDQIVGRQIWKFVRN
ncbi:MAG TPA: hypothetical protein PKA32_04115, partial [Candidatus Gracilibacteria bacterium]|nr:hypothetical protein [Candidatus Gracilibacteria bacterium]